jgi:hypothetical protein
MKPRDILLQGRALTACWAASKAVTCIWLDPIGCNELSCTVVTSRQASLRAVVSDYPVVTCRLAGLLAVVLDWCGTGLLTAWLLVAGFAQPVARGCGGAPHRLSQTLETGRRRRRWNVNGMDSPRAPQGQPKR